MKINEKKREIISYIIFGILTTAVYMISYAVFQPKFEKTLIPTVIGWVISVTFSFFVNKVFVFKSKSFVFKTLKKEAVQFAGSRLVSLAFQAAWMFILVDTLRQQVWIDDIGRQLFTGNFLEFVFIENFGKNFWSLFGNFFVMVINYIFSKWFIFKKDDIQGEKKV